MAFARDPVSVGPSAGQQQQQQMQTRSAEIARKQQDSKMGRRRRADDEEPALAQHSHHMSVPPGAAQAGRPATCWPFGRRRTKAERGRHLLVHQLVLLGCALVLVLAGLGSSANQQAAGSHLAGLMDGYAGDASSTVAGGGGGGAPTDDDGSYAAGDEESGEPGEPDESAADRSHELAERNLMMDHHNSQLRAMHHLFERRQLAGHHQQQQQQQQQQQASQELSPISIGLEPGAGNPFGMAHFQVPHQEQVVGQQQAQVKPAPLASADEQLGPTLPFGLGPLPHLLGFQGYEGPQRGDQSAHSNQHALPAAEPDQKVWPKIFRFTDGRISLEEFEKQKKIRLSNKNKLGAQDNHIESAPIMFDGRQLKRKSFLILHGGIFS